MMPLRRIGVMVLGALLAAPCGAYPLDGDRYTGIARLEGYRLAQQGEIKGRTQPPGALLALDQVGPGFEADDEFDLPTPHWGRGGAIPSRYPSRGTHGPAGARPAAAGEP